MDTLDFHALFALDAAAELPPPPVPTAHHVSSLQFLEGIHRRKSEQLKAVVMQQGWPNSEAYDGHAEAAAFMIVQHADYDLDFQRLCHGLMLDAVEDGGEARLGYLAFLTDRILCNEGKHQRFGTQIREVENGCFVPKPIEDADRVDGLRERVGLKESLSEYFLRVNGGDLLLYRPLLNGYAEELEERKENKVVEFPQSSN